VHGSGLLIASAYMHNLFVSYTGLIEADDPKRESVTPNSLPRKIRRNVQPGKSSRPSPVLQGLLGNGLRHHQAGRLAEAERIYRQILAIDARQADCLHLLGMVAYQAGRHEVAIEMIRQAIAIDKKVPAYHSNLGTVLQAQGRLDEAAASYSRALALQPQLAEAHYNLGNVLHAQEKLDDAIACYQRALALQPGLAEAHYNLGNAFLAQAPDKDKLDEAVACYQRALALQPEKVEALHNLGNALQSQDKLDDAMACFERVLALQPSYAKAHYSLGCAYHALGNLDEALARYRIARDLPPDFAQAGFSESLAQLLQGNFAEGWRNFELRWQTRNQDHDTPMRPYPQPLWTGEKLASGRVLIWGEQGIGDEIMFAGLIPDVMRTGTPCVLDCNPRLKPLFTRSFPGIEVVSGHALYPGYAANNDPQHNSQLDIAPHLPSGSLPGLFRQSSAAFAATTSPYLIADPCKRERIRARYADADADRRRLVGLAWHTNNRKTGRQRSIDLSLFAPLFARPDIRWVSLQYGDHDALQNQAAVAGAPIFIDRSVDQLVDIDLFAAQVAAMDMVITVDNSTAHLAGALGILTWVLLPFAPDWRWLQSRPDSPWYPTLRLFRQLRRGDWESVVQTVQSTL
jgi:tetratricopeptide (TPR) repeat protein